MGGGTEVLTPFFMKTPYIAYSDSCFKFCPTLSSPLPQFLSPPPATPRVLSVVLFLLLNGWSRHIWCAVLLNNNMDLYMSSLDNLVPEGPYCCVFYATRRQVCWGLTRFFSGTLDFTNTQTHTAHSGTSRMTRPYKCIFTPIVMCSKQLYYIKWLKKWLNE